MGEEGRAREGRVPLDPNTPIAATPISLIPERPEARVAGRIGLMVWMRRPGRRVVRGTLEAHRWSGWRQLAGCIAFTAALVVSICAWAADGESPGGEAAPTTNDGP